MKQCRRHNGPRVLFLELELSLLLKRMQIKKSKRLALLALVTSFATMPMIALLTSSVGIELISSSARVTSVKSQKSGPIDRTRNTWVDKNQ